MSKDAREWVWEHSSSRGTARLVLLSIADRVPDEQCVAWASITSLMQRTNASRNAVRSALTALAESGELETLETFTGPQRSTVYRLPHTAAWLAAATTDDLDAYVEPAASDPVPEVDGKRLRKHGIWSKGGAESDPRRQNPTGSESAPSRQNPTPRRVGSRPPEGSETDPQNRSEPKVNRSRYSSSGAAALIPATAWQVEPDTHTWTRQQGHLDRLGEQGLAAADAKWRAHRAEFQPRTAGAWAADWRSWIAREHNPTPSRPNLYALPGQGPSPAGGLTRTEAHTAALRAALDEPNGTE
ncbi:helix-turn-helix domain-containing protein [Streptomyces niveus]|uniref:helix-turn-helix domain-containing protein n=1 Tax=Streptomyces niveus TaxID=193462 RepID=UPI00369B7A4B